jgi:hypothetical protein
VPLKSSHRRTQRNLLRAGQSINATAPIRLVGDVADIVCAALPSEGEAVAAAA